MVVQWNRGRWWGFGLKKNYVKQTLEQFHRVLTFGFMWPGGTSGIKSPAGLNNLKLGTQLFKAFVHFGLYILKSNYAPTDTHLHLALLTYWNLWKYQVLQVWRTKFNWGVTSLQLAPLWRQPWWIGGFILLQGSHVMAQHGLQLQGMMVKKMEASAMMGWRLHPPAGFSCDGTAPSTGKYGKEDGGSSHDGLVASSSCKIFSVRCFVRFLLLWEVSTPTSCFGDTPASCSGDISRGSDVTESEPSHELIFQILMSNCNAIGQ